MRYTRHSTRPAHRPDRSRCRRGYTACHERYGSCGCHRSPSRQFLYAGRAARHLRPLRAVRREDGPLHLPRQCADPSRRPPDHGGRGADHQRPQRHLDAGHGAPHRRREHLLQRGDLRAPLRGAGLLLRHALQAQAPRSRHRQRLHRVPLAGQRSASSTATCSTSTATARRPSSTSSTTSTRTRSPEHCRKCYPENKKKGLAASTDWLSGPSSFFYQCPVLLVTRGRSS